MKPIAVVAATILLGLPLAHAQAQHDEDVIDSLRIPIGRYDGSLTPYSFEAGYSLMTLVYDTLLWRDAGGEPRPWLARSVKVSEGGRSITIVLDDGARWHDGRAVTAADVVFTFDFVRSRYHPRFTPQLAAVRQVTARDPATVVVELRYPSPGFADQPLSDLPILPKHLWQEIEEGDLVPPGLPLGSGPYRLTSHGPRQGYRFEANGDYFKGPPQVAVVEVPVERSFPETIEMLRNGDADMLPVSLPVDEANALETRSIAIARGPLYSGTVLMLNVRRPPFEDADVRRALAEGLNLRAIARAAGDAIVAEFGYLHPASGWASDRSLHSFDPDSARRALSDLDIEAFKVLSPDNDPHAIAAGRQVVLDLRALGLDVVLEKLRPPRLAAAIGQGATSPTFAAAIWSSPALASYDPDFLRWLFGSNTGMNQLNYSGYSSDEFDAAARRAARARDDAARREEVAEVLRILARDLPHIPLFFSTGAFAYRPGTFDGWTFITGRGILDKRSFLPPAEAQRGETGPPAGVAPSADPEQVNRINWLRVGAIGMLGLALLLVLAGLLRRA